MGSRAGREGSRLFGWHPERNGVRSGGCTDGDSIKRDLNFAVEVEEHGEVGVEEASEVEVSEALRGGGEVEVLRHVACLKEEVSVAPIIVFPQGSVDDGGQDDHGGGGAVLALGQDQVTEDGRRQRREPHFLESVCDDRVVVDTLLEVLDRPREDVRFQRV